MTQSYTHYADHFASFSDMMRMQDLPPVVRSADALRVVIWDYFIDSAGRDTRTVRDILQFDTPVTLGYFIAHFNRHRNGWQKCGDTSAKIECLRATP